MDYNKTQVNNKYVINFMERDSNIIKLNIKKGDNKLVIRDSYCIFSDKLSNLAKNFKVNTLKSSFPYKFSTRDTLF